MDQDEIAVIIPCFNEAQTIGKVVDDFHRELPEATVYVYDNASTDATAAIAMKHGATVRYEPRRGKGMSAARCSGISMPPATSLVDGDDTYPAEAAKGLCAPIIDKKADMVVGDRLSNGTYAKANRRAFHGLGNNLVRAMIKWIYGYEYG